MIGLCWDWEFTRKWTTAFCRGEGHFERVSLPHTAGEVPLHYAKPEDYAGICGYRRTVSVPIEYRGKRLFLQFDGAAHLAEVYVNGEKVASHACGYTAFRVEITHCVRYGMENRLAVRLDTTENPAVPPFGFVLDYLAYGGLYREVWLDVRNATYIEDVFVMTPSVSSADITLTVSGKAARRRVSILDRDGTLCAQAEGDGDAFRIDCPAARAWSLDEPNLYFLRAELLDEDGAVTDEKTVRFGFRTAEFRRSGFYLNGERVFLRGLNRHQCYPYMGYAAPASLQREDARILKEELCCTAVRTSHYPQSQHFIDACDELGLAVFTELPGWQHIGDEAWKKQSVRNVREMVMQYRNHPSVVLWGVRINESRDDDDFYRETNAAAHELDPSRQTSGVRYLQKSRLLEDVYAYNDFTHDGKAPAIKKRTAVTPDMNKPYLISENNGHMFPTKSFDPWEKRQEHALRHARVQNAAAADGEISACFSWVMFDYPTHKDFGSGDRVCYHGVMDAFRNPKLAAALYASQGEKTPMLEVGTPMDIGDYAAGNIGDIWAFTNAEEVALYKNDVFVASFRPKGWDGLKHGPIAIDDTIGEMLETQEHFPHEKAELLRQCLVSAGKYGLSMPAADKAKLAWAMVRYKMKFTDGMALYGKYVGNWGGEATRWRFEARTGGKTVASVTRASGSRLRMEIKVSQTALREGDTYDAAAVRVRILDEYGTPAVYAQLPIRFALAGDAAFIGPDIVTAEGGMCGTYVRTIGKDGEARLRISAHGLPDEEIRFTIRSTNETANNSEEE